MLLLMVLLLWVEYHYQAYKLLIVPSDEGLQQQHSHLQRQYNYWKPERRDWVHFLLACTRSPKNLLPAAPRLHHLHPCCHHYPLQLSLLLLLLLVMNPAAKPALAAAAGAAQLGRVAALGRYPWQEKRVLPAQQQGRAAPATLQIPLGQVEWDCSYCCCNKVCFLQQPAAAAAVVADRGD
jgi:hypothetical protein